MKILYKIQLIKLYFQLIKTPTKDAYPISFVNFWSEQLITNVISFLEHKCI